MNLRIGKTAPPLKDARVDELTNKKNGEGKQRDSNYVLQMFS
jgi:hypothetical protein